MPNSSLVPLGRRWLHTTPHCTHFPPPKCTFAWDTHTDLDPRARGGEWQLITLTSNFYQKVTSTAVLTPRCAQPPGFREGNRTSDKNDPWASLGSPGLYSLLVSNVTTLDSPTPSHQHRPHPVPICVPVFFPCVWHHSSKLWKISVQKVFVP